MGRGAKRRAFHTPIRTRATSDDIDVLLLARPLDEARDTLALTLGDERSQFRRLVFWRAKLDRFHSARKVRHHPIIGLGRGVDRRRSLSLRHTGR